MSVEERSRAQRLEDLADLPRWVAWHEEWRTNKAGEEYKTKIAYDPHTSRQAKIPTEPSTWGTRAHAERRWQRMRGDHDVGGVGIVLGELEDGSLLMGIDLDHCFKPKSEMIKSWAVEIIERFNTYAEVSPSGRGVKLFFLIAKRDVATVKQLLGINDKGQPKTRKTFPAGTHREIAIDRARFYAVTWNQLPDVTKTLRVVSVEDVRWFIEEAGPRYQELHGVGRGAGWQAARDESGSGYGFRFMQDRKAAGDTYEQAVAEILADRKEAGEWARRVDDRQLRRAFERASASGSIHSWEEPDLSILDDRRGELPAFPLDALNPEWLRDWVKRAAHGTGTSVDHVAVPLLGISSSLIGTRRRVQPARSWSEPMTLWCGVVGFSGTGKTPGIDATRKALDDIEYEREDDIAELHREHAERVELAAAAKAQWKADVKEAKKQHRPVPSLPEGAEVPGELVIPHLFTSDTTIERMGLLLKERPQGMLLLTDELAGWFHNMSRYAPGGQDNQFWLQAWDGRSHVVERVTRPSYKRDHLLVGVTGGMQPDKMNDMFKGAADGLDARFLFAWPEPAPYRPLSDAVDEVDAKIKDMLKRLWELPERSPSRLWLSKEAVDKFEELRKQVYDESRLLDGREREWWAKLPAQTLRLAGTLTFIDWALEGGAEPKLIKQRYVVAAARLLLDYFWPHARAALRQIGLSQRDAHLRRVLHWIAASQSEQVAREDIRRKALAQSFRSNSVWLITMRV